MQYELLCGGPIDGLSILASTCYEYLPSLDVLREYPLSQGTRYLRRRDGRLHFEFSRWDEAN